MEFIGHSQKQLVANSNRRTFDRFTNIQEFRFFEARPKLRNSDQVQTAKQQTNESTRKRNKKKEAEVKSLKLSLWHILSSLLCNCV